MHTNRRFITAIVFLLISFFISASSTCTADEQNTSSEKEKELLAVLRSDAPSDKKAITCKLLAIHGSTAAVPDLALLLSDPELASWSRIALEVIPGSEADGALRNATKTLQGRLLVGTINSIGVRQDSEAVKLLTKYLQDEDVAVAASAAIALGKIGNSAAADSLRQALAVASVKFRSDAAAEGCILCAERFLTEGKSADAIQLYDEVRKSNLPQQRILEATRGAILARNDKGIPLLLEQFRSADKELFEIALSTAREFPGNKVDTALAAEMVRAQPDRAALIIQAMADRPETVVLSAVLDAAKQGPKPVRLASINALGRVGNASCLSTLLAVAIEPDSDLSNTAKATLAILPGAEVDQQIKENLGEAQGKTYPLLIQLVGQRRIQATASLLKALKNSDTTVRGAALYSLGETVDLKGLSILIAQVVSPEHSEDVTVAQKALKAASIRMPDREACATQLTAAIEETSSVTTKTAILKILGAVGGTKALETIAIAAKQSDTQLQDVSSRLLGEWMTADAAPVLLDLTKSAPAEKFRIRALRGYIRIARQFDIPEKERAAMCSKALEASHRMTEKKMVLGVLKRYPNMMTLKLAVDALKTPELNSEATQVTLVIAQKIGDKDGGVNRLLSQAGLEKVKLEIIKAEYGSGDVQKDVTELLRKQSGDMMLIVLPSSSYNSSFGGDPLPGVTKQLKIKYRINGREGETSFAENTSIFLPIPK